MKLFSKLSLGNKLLLIVTFFFIIPLISIFLTSYKTSENIISEKIDQATNYTLQQLNSSVQRLVDDLGKATAIMLTDRKVDQMLQYYNGISESNNYYLYGNTSNVQGQIQYDKLNISNEFDSTFASITNNLLSSNTQIGIFTLNGTLFSTWSTNNTDFDLINKNEWLAKAKNLRGVPFYVAPHKSYITQNSREYISYIKEIYDRQNGSTDLGALIISVPISDLTQLIKESQISQLSSVVVLDSNGKHVINIPNSSGGKTSNEIEVPSLERMVKKSGSFTATVDGNKALINYYTIEMLNWKMVSIIPYDTLFSEIRGLRYTVLSLSIILTFVFSAITLLLIFKITKPLKRLKKSMEDVKSGDLMVVMQNSETNDEIGILSSTFNAMLTELRALITKAGEDKKRESELRFEMLMAQINPHFLFNTLNSIKWMAVMSRADNISSTITALGRLLEISMNKQNDIITIQEEIENVKSYVLIQKVRYNDRFDVIYDIDDNLLLNKTLKLIMQPIVENAIIHNIEQQDYVEIIICVKKHFTSDDTVEISISDNGSGIDSETVKSFLDIYKSDKKMFSGIGVSNVLERIQLRFGTEYGIEINSSINKGTTVKILIPYGFNE